MKGKAEGDEVQPCEWMKVQDVKKEMNLSTRAAWALVKRLGVKVVDPENATAAKALFLRAEFEDARKRSMGPPIEKAAAAAPSSNPPRAKTDPKSYEAKLSRLRSG